MLARHKPGPSQPRGFRARSAAARIICCLAAGFVTVLAAAVLAAAPVAAQVRWVMATEYPASNISGVGLTTFARIVSSRTGGAVSIDTALNNELKIPSGEMPSAAQAGRIAGGDAFAGPLEAIDPVFGLASLPFVVQSVEAAKAVNGRARPLYEKALAARGLKLLYMTIWPPTGLWTAQPVTRLDDLRSLSVRCYDDTSTEVLQAAGAKAEYLPFNAAIAKLKSHQLNAILTSGDGGAGRKLWDELPDFAAIDYAVPISLAFVRSDTFAALPKQQQDEVAAAAAETEKSQFDLLANRIVENYATMRKNGVTIEDPAPASLLAALKHAASKPIDAWKHKVSAEAVAIVDDAERR